MENVVDKNRLYIQVNKNMGSEQQNRTSYPTRMMKPLKEVFSMYTDILKVSIQDFLDMPNQKNADEYIETYFKNRSKNILFEVIVKSNEGKFESRSIHMVSAFLLGFYIQDKMKNSFSNEIIGGKWKYEYLWFMSCLYHDEFSGTEQIENCSNMSINDILSIQTGNERIHTIYDKNICGIQLPIPTYQRKDVEAYFQYRLANKNIDHGIKGGYVAFQKLVENYLEERSKKGNRECFLTTIKDKDDKEHTLVWDNKQIEAFAYVADAIIVHNIWHVAGEEEKTIYREKGLQSFIVGDTAECKLTIGNSPLAYLLSMVDTIEPVKYFHKQEESEEIEKTAKRVFDNITILIDRNCIVIGQSDNKQYDLKKWYEEKMRNMSDWLYGIHVSYNEKMDTICIQIPQSLRCAVKIRT